MRLLLQSDPQALLPIEPGVYTDVESIQRVFGPLPDNRVLTVEEYAAVIQKCTDNGWTRWRGAFERWRSEGVL